MVGLPDPTKAVPCPKRRALLCLVLTCPSPFVQAPVAGRWMEHLLLLGFSFVLILVFPVTLETPQRRAVGGGRAGRPGGSPAWGGCGSISCCATGMAGKVVCSPGYGAGRLFAASSNEGASARDSFSRWVEEETERCKTSRTRASDLQCPPCPSPLPTGSVRSGGLFRVPVSHWRGRFLVHPTPGQT